MDQVGARAVLRNMRAGERRTIGGISVLRPSTAERYDVAGLGPTYELDLDTAAAYLVDQWPLRLASAQPVRRATPARGIAVARAS